MMKKIIISMILCINYTNSEFILYKVDSGKADNINFINYDDLSAGEQTNLFNLVNKTLFCYQWPMILSCYGSLTEQEKKEYLEALEKPRGLFNLIKNKVELLSNKTYSIAWVPTTVFELIALDFFVSSINEDTLKIIFDKDNKFFEKEPNNHLLIEWYCNICDVVNKDYRINDKFIFEITPENFVKIIEVVKQYGNLIFINRKSLSFGSFCIRGRYKYYMNYIYNGEMLPIIQKYLQYEQQAFEKNMFILSRGTNGYDRSNIFYFDYELGFFRGLSYGYSLFAGTVFERYSDSSEPHGARSIDYIIHNKIGYLLLCNISDVFNGQKIQNIFDLPVLNTIQSLFEHGETFHPRLNSKIRELSSLEKSRIAKQLAGYLSHAQLIKLYKNITESNEDAESNEDIKESNEILDQDKRMQMMIVSHEEAQSRFSIEKEEEMERFETIVLPMLKSGKFPLKNVPDDMLKYINKPIFDQLKDSQLQNVTLSQIGKFSKDLEEDENVFKKILSPMLISGNLPLDDLPFKMLKFIDLNFCTQMSRDILNGSSLMRHRMDQLSMEVQRYLRKNGVVVR